MRQPSNKRVSKTSGRDVEAKFFRDFSVVSLHKQLISERELFLIFESIIYITLYLI